MITMWYLQSQRTWDKLCHSCIGSSFLPRGAFPEGRAYAFSPRLHAGSLEALRVARPEAVELVRIKRQHELSRVPGPVPLGTEIEDLRQQLSALPAIVSGLGELRSDVAE